MRLVELTANKDSFRTVEFRRGLNIILAERTTVSRDTDSRNGVGKTTLLQIIDFCLGARPPAGEVGISRLSGEDWSFSLRLDVNDLQVVVTRAVDDQSIFILTGDLRALGISSDETLDGEAAPVKLGERAYTDALGRIVFGLETAAVREQYAPTFRQLLGHFLRYRQDAFISPFETFGKQPVEQTQANNTYLLGLDWHIATEWQRLKDRKKTLTALGKQGIEDATSELGELESRRVRVSARLHALNSQVSTFRVVSEYRELETRLNATSRRMRDITNETTILASQIQLYEAEVLEASTAEEEVSVAALFEEAGVLLPEQVVRTLDEVRSFHASVNQNRRAYLQGEIARLQQQRRDLLTELDLLETSRVRDMSRLSEGGALDEYSQLQQELGVAAGELSQLDTRIDTLRKLRAGKAALRKEELLLQERAQLDLDERRPVLSPAIEQFTAIFEHLYGEPADLIVDVGSSGYQFGTQLPRQGSHGVGKVSVFAYDLSIAHAMRLRSAGVGLLAHDSVVLDGVDERQSARALQLLLEQVDADDLQYLVTLNSDDAPRDELEALGIPMDEHVTLTLTDADERGSLLGIRF